MENVLGRGEQYCKGDVVTKLSRWGPMRPVCERGSRKLHRLEFPCESWLVAGKQRPVDKGFGNLGLSHLHSGVSMEQGQGKHVTGFFFLQCGFLLPHGSNPVPVF